MPAPNQIHPSQKRERMANETDEQYAERMEYLDRWDSILGITRSTAPRRLDCVATEGCKVGLETMQPNT